MDSCHASLVKNVATYCSYLPAVLMFPLGDYGIVAEMLLFQGYQTFTPCCLNMNLLCSSSLLVYVSPSIQEWTK